MEQWHDLAMHRCSAYSVSSFGRVYNKDTDRMMSLSKNQQGFLKVSLITDQRERVTLQVNRLVAHFFLPGFTEIFNTPIHLNGNRDHIFVKNLMWRPRWFALSYHRQFDHNRYLIDDPLEEIDTGEIFEGSRPVIRRYGLLERDIVQDLVNQRGVFPNGQLFRLLR